MQLKLIIFVSVLANCRAWSREKEVPIKSYSQFQTLDLFINEKPGRRASTSAGVNQESQILSCDDAMQGDEDSGSYIINIRNKPPFFVYCETDPDGGPAWTVIQRRKDGSVDFNRKWADYKEGFGHIEGEYWLGLEQIHALTTSVRHELWIEMFSWKNESITVKYSSFAIGSEKQNYELNVVGKFTGDVDDALGKHAGYKFSTKDMDSSSGCPDQYKGGWWFRSCFWSFFNGEYVFEKNATTGRGMKWHSLQDNLDDKILKYVHMAIRPLQ